MGDASIGIGRCSPELERQALVQALHESLEVAERPASGRP
jgi:hypothetical protein